MALSDKNIVITPNIGQSADPKIVFSGADSTTSAQNISLSVYPASSGTLSFDGSAGQLFSITNSLSGSLFSVNDVSGIPSIEVLDSGAVKLAQYGGNVGIGLSNPSSKLEVAGSVKISQDLTVSGNVYISGNTATLSSNNLVLNDSIIYLANNNPANLNDIGFVGNFTSGVYQHTGLVRDATDGVWKLFSNVVPEPTNTVDFTSATYDTLKTGIVIADLYGNANTSTKLTTAKTIALSGAVTGTATEFDGSANVTINTTVVQTANLVGIVANTNLGTGTANSSTFLRGDGVWATQFAATKFHTLDNPNPYDTSDGDGFGYSLAISGNYAIVGAMYEDESGATDSGKVYIYDIKTGTLLHTLDNPNPFGTKQSDLFGYSVAISGNYAIVGTIYEDDIGGNNSGKAYIYNVTTGTLLHTLDNPNAYGTSQFDIFGVSVAISGNYAIVGAVGEDDSGGLYSGKAYIYNVTTGALLYTLDNPNANGTSANDSFGTSVAISGNYAIVGAPGETLNGETNSGKAYIFDVTTGTLWRTLNNPNVYGLSQNDFFGRSVAISGNYAIVGANWETNTNGIISGETYIYNVTTGTLLFSLDNPNAYGTSDSDSFGNSVAISGNYAIVGAPQEDDIGGVNSGKAYIYNITTGALLCVLDNPNAYGTSGGDSFGNSVAISGNYAIVGAPDEIDSNGSYSSGKVYIYQLPNAEPYTPSADEFNSFITGSADILAFSMIF